MTFNDPNEREQKGYFFLVHHGDGKEDYYR